MEAVARRRRHGPRPAHPRPALQSLPAGAAGERQFRPPHDHGSRRPRALDPCRHARDRAHPPGLRPPHDGRDIRPDGHQPAHIAHHPHGLRRSRPVAGRHRTLRRPQLHRRPAHPRGRRAHGARRLGPNCPPTHARSGSPPRRLRSGSRPARVARPRQADGQHPLRRLTFRPTGLRRRRHPAGGHRPLRQLAAAAPCV